MKAMRLALLIVAGVLSLAVASPAVAAPPTIDDQTFTVTRADALAAYEESGEVFQDCGDFVVLAAFTVERRVITFEDRELRLVSFTGELFRQDTGVAVTYAGSARIQVTFDPTGEIETITTTGLARYLIDLEGNRIVFDAGYFTGDFSSFPPTLIEHGLKRYEEVICGALA
jgi:outer membrane receptor protein involved in Fe transport